MTDTTSHTLDAPPTADDVTALREEAAGSDSSVTATYSLEDGTERRLVVSPRGTCVVLEGNTSNDALNPDTPAEDVAAVCTA